MSVNSSDLSPVHNKTSTKGENDKKCFNTWRHLEVYSAAHKVEHLGLVQTSNFSYAEPNVNNLSSLFELICIRFGKFDV